MSLQPQSIPAVPELTVTTARAAFPHGNRYMTMRDRLGVFYGDFDFAHLFATRGRPGETPWRLALVLVFQYVEGLSDEQAAEAVRSRIDWKYALSLELTDSGFDASVLSEFRTRLVEGQAEMQLLERMLTHFQAGGYLKARGRQRTDSTHVLAAVRALNRLVFVAETLRHALNTLALSAPQWLKLHLEPGWVARYERRFDEYRLPQTAKERGALAAQIGSDGRKLLLALFAPDSPRWLREIDAVRILTRVWVQHYDAVGDTEAMRWRQVSDQPSASLRIHSPYDVEARYSGKRDTTWLGYKVHLTESCDADAPHLITHVLTTPATTPDFDAPARIQSDLAAQALLPAEHLFDAGYVDAGLLVESRRDHQVEVVGPVPPDHCWQALRPGAYDVSHFQIDWEAKRVICPQGHRSQKWSQTHNHLGDAIINLRFPPAACAHCPDRTQCTRSSSGPRHMTLHPREQHEALQQRRRWQQTPEFKQQYAARAGIEGTISQSVRMAGQRRTRYLGLAKTHLHNILCAAAINLCRIVDYVTGRPRALTRHSPLVSLTCIA